MIEINFGASAYTQWAPGVPKEENIVRIPEEEELPQIGPEVKVGDTYGQVMKYTTWADPQLDWARGAFQILGYSEFLASNSVKETIQGFSAVTLTRSAESWQGPINTAMLLWIKSRQEWIAIHKREWCEGAGGLFDERYLGPFALDEMCSRKILQAYGVPEGKFTLEEIRRMSPEKLEQNSQTHQLSS